ncbi:glutamate dehydrogenase [Candidatus Acidianus copahuensis]|uniref:Glutamate dehydrogenase n=1 Tax=Candidatus Acidianus copahuensis TaxID=1160895 RepID=A0A031LU79_9CREN|nr:Glu/Leu/Phe/Val dehydrogenase [Candidatus Acidianus copahuensis]EZQ11381.1 glutamate dehydrogenase [Candidatus Acidianus copahuensis]
METASLERTNLYDQQLKILRRIGEIMGLDGDIVESLSIPERVIQVKVQLKGDTIKTFIGWRSQHNSALGPYKGGIRFHPQVTKEEVIALSMIMTWKNSIMGLPFGGGKGGLRIDPSVLTLPETERVIREYVAQMYKYMGGDFDVPAPDLNTDGQIMAWAVDEYIRLTGKNDFSSFTGKPTELNGISTRSFSTGLGVAEVTKIYAEKFMGGIEGKRIAIHGFGNVGYNSAKFLQEMGGKVVAISDVNGGILDWNGLDVGKVKEFSDRYKTVKDFPAKQISNEELLTLDVDILIPASIEGVINAMNAHSVKAKLIVEGANGPISVKADEILKKRGVIIIPDIIANAGGVIGSYVEWANNKIGGIIEEEEVKRIIRNKMREAMGRVMKTTEKYESDYRTAAMINAVDRVVKSAKLRM